MVPGEEDHRVLVAEGLEAVEFLVEASTLRGVDAVAYPALADRDRCVDRDRGDEEEYCHSGPLSWKVLYLPRDAGEPFLTPFG